MITGFAAVIIIFTITGHSSAPVHPQRDPIQDPKGAPTPAPSPTPRPALSGGWTLIHAAMTKSEVQSLLGVPNLKSDRKWGYVGGGLVSFDAQGLVSGFTAPK